MLPVGNQQVQKHGVRPVCALSKSKIDADGARQLFTIKSKGAQNHTVSTTLLIKIGTELWAGGQNGDENAQFVSCTGDYILYRRR